MDVTTYTHAREHLAEIMDKVCETGAPVIIKRRGRPAVVMLSLAEWRAWKETVHIMSNPRNAQELLDGIEEFKRGEFVEHELIDPAPAKTGRRGKPRKAMAAE
jgi:antitoxin YefM